MKKLTIKDFKEKKIAVTFDSLDEYKDFLKKCQKFGLQSDYYLRNIRKDDVNLILTCGYVSSAPNIITSWGSKKSYDNDYVSNIWKLTPAKLFLHEPETKIEIFQSNNTVVALKKIDGKVVAKGIAKCCPEDTFDFDFGAKLALERMYCGNIKKCDHYNVGDRVKIVDKLEGLGHGLVTEDDKKFQGKVVTISYVLFPSFGKYLIKEDNGKAGWFDNEIAGKVL